MGQIAVALHVRFFMKFLWMYIDAEINKIGLRYVALVIKNAFAS